MRAGLPKMVVLLGVLTVVFGCLAAWFGAEAGNANSGTDTSNAALTDSSGTSMLIAAVTAEAGRLFSYNYIDPQPTLSAEHDFLTGAAVKQYPVLLGAVQQKAQHTQGILTYTVTSVGVEILAGSTARVLVFGQESARTASQASAGSYTAMFGANVALVNGQWKISSIDTYV